MAVQQEAIRRVFEEVSLGARENAIGFVLWRITSRYQREMDRALAVIDLSNLQFVTLALVGWLKRSETIPTQVELSRFGGIHPMQLSQMLKILEGKRFVERKRDAVDNREKRVTLTRKGLATLERALPLVIEVQSRLFGNAGAKGSDLLNRLLALDTQVRASTESES